MSQLKVGDTVLHRLDHRKMLVIDVGTEGGWFKRVYNTGLVLCHYVDNNGEYRDEWFPEEVLAS